MRVRCSLVALALMVALVLGCKKKKQEPAATPAEPNVVLVTVDTLRADRLGCYGFDQARTPHVDLLAKQGVLAEHAIATVPITLPSHASILTGLYPPAHGVRDNGIQTVPEDVETLAERLKQKGYRTQAFVSAGVLHHRFNLDQGFDGYDDQLQREGDPGMFRIQERSGQHTMDRVLTWLDRNGSTPDDASPFFLWVHLFDPHQPYAPPEADAKASPTLYDGEIASVDRQIGRLVEKLSRRGVLDDTILMLTSDHGESLGEHGEATHAIFIYESTVRVPFIIRYPPKIAAGTKYRHVVRGVDVMPTILGLAGLDVPKTQGADLSGALTGKEQPPALVAYSESLDPQIEFAMAPLHGIRDERWTYIRAPRSELYDRLEDPGELHNLLEMQGPQKERAAAKAEELDRVLSGVLEDSERFGFVAPANPLDRQTVEMLQALGYMQESDASRGVEGMDPKDGIRAFNQMDAARQLSVEGNYEGAKKILLSLLQWLPKNASARNLLAMCELRTGNPDAAKRLYRESLAYDPHQPQVLTQLGRMALAAGNAKMARQRFQAALDVDPAYTDAMILLAYLEIQEGHQAEAVRWYDAAIEADPGDPSAYLQYGDLHFRAGDYAQAKRWYDKALQADPDNYIGSLQAGTSALRMGDLDAARSYFQRASELDATAWAPLYNLACIQTHRGQTEAALHSLGEAVRRGLADRSLPRRDACFAPLRTDPRFQRLTGTR